MNGATQSLHNYDIATMLPNLNMALVPIWDVVVQSEKEHESEEEAETAEKVPEVVVVEEVEAGKTLLVLHLGVGGADVGLLHPVDEEVDGRRCADDGEDEEGPAGRGWHLLGPQLHHDVEAEVEEEVGEKDHQEDLGQIHWLEDYGRCEEVEDEEGNHKLKSEDKVWNSSCKIMLFIQVT